MRLKPLDPQTTIHEWAPGKRYAIVGNTTNRVYAVFSHDDPLISLENYKKRFQTVFPGIETKIMEYVGE